MSLSKRPVRVYRGYPRGLAGQIAAAAGCARIGTTALPFFEGSLDLDADRVGLFCDPQTAAFGPSQPFGTYDGHKDVVLLARLLDVLAKIARLFFEEGETETLEWLVWDGWAEV